MPSLKLYKLRPLTKAVEIKRAKHIIHKGEFWCSKFISLNDPMEGVFKCAVHASLDAYSKKAAYKICSFSSVKAFSNPAMWGYYAAGFCGVAIEVTIEESEVREVQYVEDISDFGDVDVVQDDIERILTTKLNVWQHEYEYRYLKPDVGDQLRIGQITGLYFGDPYCSIDNQSDILKDCGRVVKYRDVRKRLIRIAPDIPKYGVRIIGHEVVGCDLP